MPNVHNTTEGVRPNVKTLTELQAIAKPLPWLHQRRHCKGQLGHQQAKRLGQGMEFQECRPYQPGDDIRHIHWRVTARTQQAYSKIYSEDHERPVCVWLDLAPSMFFGTRQHYKSVLAIKVAATIAWSCYQSKERLASFIQTPQHNRFTPPKYNLQHLLHCMNQLASASDNTTASTPPRGPAITDFSPHRAALPSGSIITLLTDGYDPAAHWFDTLSQLAPKYLIHLIHVFDPLEAQFSKAGIYPVQYDNQTHYVHMQSKSQRTQYRQAFEVKQRALKQHCQQLGVHWHSLSTADTWQQQIFRW